uniref:Uncharacterized protein n=1 Tax=Lepeophtheirus salmonis TaxID=72036 RepID=A0A0K2U7D3_LEPSM
MESLSQESRSAFSIGNSASSLNGLFTFNDAINFSSLVSTPTSRSSTKEQNRDPSSVIPRSFAVSDILLGNRISSGSFKVFLFLSTEGLIVISILSMLGGRK